ncbi:response regulator [Streptomyces sp. NPDC049099]|uniref:response regulator n=1 Tax=Streptomyces sp. NPDC049099 TaxID=3155768 RepID=UPI003444ADB2
MRVTVVDDSVIVREGLRRLLESEGHEVIDLLTRPGQVLSAVAAARPDAVILDCNSARRCSASLSAEQSLTRMSSENS